MSKASFVKIFSPLFIFLIFFGAVHAQENEYIPMGPEGTIGNTAPESTVPGNNVNQNKPATVSNTAQGPAAKGVYTPLVNLPGLDGANRTLPEYINVLFRLAVGIGALIAVVKIIVAGVKYMSSDVVFSKEEAKKDIQNSLLGLLIILSTVVVLQTINRNILNLDILQRMSPLQSVAEPAVVVEPAPTAIFVDVPPNEDLQRMASSSGVTIDFSGGLSGSTSGQTAVIRDKRAECSCKGGTMHSRQTTDGSVMQCEIPNYLVKNPPPLKAGCAEILGLNP